MNPLAACTSSKRRQKQPIRLPEDDEDTDEELQHSHRTSCIMPVWPFTQCLGPRHGGRLTLGEDGDNNPSSRILDEYLDPNTTVGIEPLLDQHAQDPNDDDNNDDIITGSGSGGSTFFSGKAAVDPHQFLSRNPFATTNSNTTTEQNERRVIPEQDYFFEEDDAQFLSDHRISAVINNHAKNMESDNNTGASANPVSRTKTEEEEEQKKRTIRTVEDYGQELIDVTPSKLIKEENSDDNANMSSKCRILDHYQERELKSIDESSTTGRELQGFSKPIVDQELVDIHSASSAQQEPRELDDFNTGGPTERELVDIKYSSPASTQPRGPEEFNHSTKIQEVSDIKSPSCSAQTKKLQDFNDSLLVEKELVDISKNADSKSLLEEPVKELQEFTNNKDAPAEQELTDFDHTNSSRPRQPVPEKNFDKSYNNTTAAVTTTFPLTTSELRDFSNTTIVERETSHQNISNDYNSTTQVSNKSREFHVPPPPPEERESGSIQAPLRAMSQPPSPRPKTHEILLESSGGKVDKDMDREESGAGTSGRRSSVAVVAQSLLGDRLDDFTEKLAFIKKNIIMSLEDEDGYDDEQQQQLQQHQQPIQQQHQQQSMDLPKRRPSYDPLMSTSSSATSRNKPRQQHKRSSSFMEVAGKFMSQLNEAALANGNNSHNNKNSTTNANSDRVFSPSSFFATLAGPDENKNNSRQFSNAPPMPRENNHQDPLSTTGDDYYHQQHERRQHHSHNQRTLKTSWADDVPEEDEEETHYGDEEDLFDFTKVAKNVRNMGEDMVGNGLRMFNDMANRVKNANKQEVPGENSDEWMLDRDAWI